MENHKARNGKIDFFRFVFSVIVVIFHINKDFWDFGRVYLDGRLSLAGYGGCGVEYFFIVSGFLFALSLSKRTETDDLARDDFAFVWRKAKAILPYHFIACAIAILFILIRLIGGDKGFDVLLDKLPSLFLMQAFQLSGNNDALLGQEWYISTMLLVMFLLYPFAVKFKKAFTGIAAPAIGLFLLGRNAVQNGLLIGTDHNMRGLQDICLGIFCFYVYTKLKDLNPGRRGRVLITVIEAFCYLVSTVYCFTAADAKYQIYIAVLFCIGVTLSFSELGVISSGKLSTLFNNRFVYLLGKWSLPIYLIQNAVRSGMLFIKEKKLVKVSDSVFAAADLVLILIAGIVLYYIVEFFRKRIAAKKAAGQAAA